MPFISKKKAEYILYSLWENGLLPSNFTEDHSEYELALNICMKKGTFSLYMLNDY